jgi:hypothetical protein
MPDVFDRMMGGLHGLPDVLSTKATTVREVVPIVGETMTFIVQTYRQTEKGDTVFLEVVTGPAHTRLVLPPNVSDTIARQREALVARGRSRRAKAAAAARKEAGIAPAFTRNPGRGRRRKRS